MEHPIVSREEWIEARKALLLKEKELTRMRDRVNAERLALPWVRIAKRYIFQTPEGPRPLGELFGGRSQLVIYHFMLGEGWGAGCPGCSFLSDHIDGTLAHLNHHDVTFLAVSHASLAEIENYKRRMGWRFPWVSSHGSDFNHDFHVAFTKEELASGSVTYNFEQIPAERAHDELPGLSAFYRNESGEVFHSYSCYARGLEEILSTYAILDRAPLGRNEEGTMNWVRRHDEYDGVPASSCCATAAATEPAPA